MVRLEEILEKVEGYNPQADLDIIKKAYVFSGMVHKGQTRRSGEPYLIHPLEVANILAVLKMDAPAVATGLLHDTVEDTHTTVGKIEEVFGAEIAALVDGLTKLSRITFEKVEDREAENFRKMLLAMSKDIRVILVKLADRLHNMRTLGAMPTEKQELIARETRDIYAPLANRLGIGWMKAELEDLAFKHLEPRQYAQVKRFCDRVGGERDKYIEEVKAEITAKLGEYAIEGTVTGRPKHLYSIYKKMMDQEVELDKIHDLIGFRVIVGSVRECYAVLGIIHSTWKPVPGRFKDYIGIPKPNLYQSLHTTIIGSRGDRMEIQIRTEEMHRISEFGIAAHWKYKEGKLVESKTERNFAWLRQLLEWQNDLKDSGEFMDTVKVDLFPEEVFVFTPQGNVKELPVGSTPVDFAYAIHTDIGHTCAAAKVDGRMVPLKHRLRNGNVVEIITNKKSHPTKEWMSFVMTSKAKTRVRQWLKVEEREVSYELGKEIFEKEFKKYGVELSSLVESGELDRVATEEFGFSDVEALFVNVGYGKVSSYQLLSKFLPANRLEGLREKKASKFRRMLNRFKVKPRSQPSGGVVVKGFDDVLVRFAKCCNPLPGDNIVGFISHGQGVTVHASKCSNMLSIDPERRLDVEWGKTIGSTRPVRIKVLCANHKGLLAQMSDAIMNADSNIVSADIKTMPENKAVNIFEVEVRDTKHLNSLIKAIQKLKRVTKVERLSV